MISYEVTVERAGQGLLEVALTSDGLPEGATVSFAKNPVRYTGHQTTIHTFLMTVTCPAVMPTETLPFTVTGSARRESITVTNQISGRLLDLNAALLLVSLEVPQVPNPALRGLGGSGRTYQIEVTSDLGNPNWTTAGLTTADGNGRFTFFDLDSDGSSPAVRFYRAVAVAPTAFPVQQD